MTTAAREKLSPTARVMMRVARKAYVAAGGYAGDGWKESGMMACQIAAWNALAEWHEGKANISNDHSKELVTALREIMDKDGPGLDLSPAGPCHDIAARALCQIGLMDDV